MRKIILILMLITHLTIAIDTCLCQNWVQQSVPFTTGIFFDMKFVNENTGFISNSTPIFIKTTNAGYNWQILNNYYITSLSIVDSMCIYGAGHRSPYSMLYKTTNCGITWDSSLNMYASYFSIHFFNRDTGIICGGDGAWAYIWRTTDGGLTKNLIMTLTNWSPYGELFFSKEKVNGEYFGLVYNGPQWYKTTNSGLNWQQMPNLPTSNEIGSIFFLNSDTGWATISNNNFNYVLYTTNGGNNWGTQTLPYSQPAFDIYFANPRKGWIGCGGLQKIYATSNGGNLWGTQNVSGNGSGKLCFFDSLTGWAQTSWNTISHTTNGGGTITKILNNDRIAKDYKLYQNYPNPFNAASNIKYIIPKSSNVRIEVMDILVRNIKTLVNEKQTAGTYQVLFDADNLPSGVYFYSLLADGIIIETKRMLMIK
ncbi:MAG: T9SS type A sorting domain-containing protein [Ignavibacteria bacterium]